ncbi:MAG: MscL family protein [Candidatus Paceibacterota bacterium]|jgi:large conductance mechanosensitive channel
MIKEFFGFLEKYNVITLAIGFVMGAAANSLANSLVKDILMPLLNPIFPESSWEEAVIVFGSVQLRAGAFLGELLHFFILALAIFLIVRAISRQKDKIASKVSRSKKASKKQ